MPIKNLLIQAFKPKRLLVMVKKVALRISDHTGGLSPVDNLAWIRSHCSSFSSMAEELNADLWREAQEVSRTLETRAETVLATVEYNLGGGGVYPFLYFIARYLQSQCIVETGVAAGYSSAAFLSALKANGRGRLYSSDFPYFRLPQPERFIGVVVEDSLRDRWELLIEGDEVNLPKILCQVDKVDVFHYDSDKSYRGRQFAMSLIVPRLAAGGVILMDDIQDNSFFHDYIRQQSVPHWRVFEYHGKYIGMIGELQRMQK